MNHLWFDDFNNLWRTPVAWPSEPRKFNVVYAEPARGYYVVYHGRRMLRGFDLEPGDPMTPEWIEELRREPDTWMDNALEAA